MAWGINWRLHCDASGSTEELKSWFTVDITHIVFEKVEVGYREPFVVHLEERSGIQLDGATTEQRNPTGDIWREREPEVANWRALFGQDVGGVD
ncbi:hypothetical protein ACWC4E_29505 [Streptomyces sp. NPDC001273]